MRIGMLADEVLKLKGRGTESATRLPRVKERDEEGFVVEWCYPDCTVEMRHRGGRYRVAKVTWS